MEQSYFPMVHYKLKMADSVKESLKWMWAASNEMSKKRNNHKVT